MTIPASELAAWSELAEKASALPWTAEPYDEPQWLVKCEEDGKQWCVGTTNQGNDEANAKYAAAAANAVPRLIAAYSQSQARVAELEARVAEIAKAYAGDYPNIETVDAIEKLWAIDQTLEGRTLAIGDLHAEIERLKRGHSTELADRLEYRRPQSEGATT